MQGEHLGPYRLDTELGSGGMGTVWRATGADGGVVAIKVVHPHLLGALGFRERFEREAKVGLAIRHANVVTTLACIDATTGGKQVPALVLEYVEGRSLTELLAELRRVPEELRGKTANALGWIMERTSRGADAEPCFRRALHIAQTRGDRKAEAVAMGKLAFVLTLLHRHDEAREHVERKLAITREIADRPGEVSALVILGVVLRHEGRFAESLEQHLQALAICREIGDRWHEASVSFNLAQLLKDENRLCESREHLQRCIVLARETGDRELEAFATGSLGDVLRAEGRLVSAREHYERQLALSRDIGWRSGEADALLSLGGTLCEERDAPGAEARLTECLALSESAGHQVDVALAHLALGVLRASPGGGDCGRTSFAAARDVAARIGGDALETLARCHMAAFPGGDAGDALASFRANEERLDAQQRREARFLLWKATGDRAHLVDARRLLDEAVANVPDDVRTSMLTNLRLNRDIVAAATAAGLS